MINNTPTEIAYPFGRAWFCTMLGIAVMINMMAPK